jgi:NADH-quinone oxidoreductase subunit H
VTPGLQLVAAAVYLGAGLSLAAGMIWIERRLLALWQDRLGPNRVGPFGLLQPLADAIKLLAKDDWIPPFSDRIVFVVAPAVVVVTALLSLAVVPVAEDFWIVDLSVGLLFFLAMSALGAYSVILAGWASASKYSFLGGMRAAAQVISYEVFLALALAGVVIQAGSFNLREIVLAQTELWFIVPQFVGFVAFMIAGLAETHRLPFDLPESETELVAGYHVEYSAMKFGLFFVGEYLAMVVVAAFVTVLFLGGWLGPVLPGPIWFLLKLLFVLSLFVLMRAALPRPRYDQLMAFGWKVLLPLTLVNALVTGAIVLALR